ncbi:MAG TPA: UdgX family uracil-DNA binding protein [Bryobacteraceae bacterium]|jgi:DNA polymerase|nr:UdgX family uracil-DNA binding protein [Bryobacteraceae bacterium]
MAGKLKPDASEYLPSNKSLPALRKAADQCKGCDLYRFATQAVFGEGAKQARLMLIGEQPGNEEDKQGRPFVGPAGRLLDKALIEANIDREQVYVTNVVKHFKFEERGKRRIHKKPNSTEVQACNPWLEAEVSLIKPAVIVCLGATAAQAILGKDYRVTRDHGKFTQHAWAPHVTATVHPSSILRAPDEEQRRAQFAEFVNDLKSARQLLKN